MAQHDVRISRVVPMRARCMCVWGGWDGGTSSDDWTERGGEREREVSPASPGWPDGITQLRCKQGDADTTAAAAAAARGGLRAESLQTTFRQPID